MPPKRAATKTKSAKSVKEPEQGVSEEVAPKTAKTTGKKRKVDAEIGEADAPETRPKRQAAVKKEVAPSTSAKTQEKKTSKKAAPKKEKPSATATNGHAASTKEEKPKRTTKRAAAARAKDESEEEEEERAVSPSELPKRNTKKRAEKTKESKSGDKEKKAPANKTATNWHEVSFGCETKNTNGKNHTLQITTWNVDGIRAWLKKGCLDILDHNDADIFCLQETKCSQEKLPDELKNLKKYKAYWALSKKEGYAGVGLLTKTMPIEVIYGIGDEDHDDEGRCITAEYKKFFLVNVYVPNAGRGLVTLDKRLDWNKKFKDFIEKLEERKPVIICGDMNVAHNEIDLANPKTNTKNAGFTPQEREGMSDFLAQGYVDIFRKLYPDKTGAYTFWSFMNNARAKNVGWRLDYFLTSKKLAEDVCDTVIHDNVFGSDHCPLSLFMTM